MNLVAVVETRLGAVVYGFETGVQLVGRGRMEMSRWWWMVVVDGGGE